MLRFLGQSIRHDVLTEIAVLLTGLVPLAGLAETIFHVRAQTVPDHTNPQTALAVEAKYVPPFRPRLEISTRVDRPFSPYENFYVPFAKAQLQLPLWASDTSAAPRSLIEARPYVTALALDRWSTDGERFRSGVTAMGRHTFASWLSVQMELTPWLELSRYRTSPDGREFPLHGFTQKITAELSYRDFFLELSFTAQQSVRTVWRNDFGWGQKLGYRFSPKAQAGLLHELVTPRLDESTGQVRSLALYDPRLSRLAVFGEFLL